MRRSGYVSFPRLVTGNIIVAFLQSLFLLRLSESSKRFTTVDAGCGNKSIQIRSFLCSPDE